MNLSIRNLSFLLLTLTGLIGCDITAQHLRAGPTHSGKVYPPYAAWTDESSGLMTLALTLDDSHRKRYIAVEDDEFVNNVYIEIAESDWSDTVIFEGASFTEVEQWIETNRRPGQWGLMLGESDAAGKTITFSVAWPKGPQPKAGYPKWGSPGWESQSAAIELEDTVTVNIKAGRFSHSSVGSVIGYVAFTPVAMVGDVIAPLAHAAFASSFSLDSPAWDDLARLTERMGEAESTPNSSSPGLIDSSKNPFLNSSK